MNSLKYFYSYTIIKYRNGVYSERKMNAWGRARDPQKLYYTTLNPFGSGSDIRRGYTMHEHLEEFNLINMNGRVYDPLLARFLNADPFIQDNTDAQNYNRYSYVLNNPTKYTDPSGYVYTNYDLQQRIQQEASTQLNSELITTMEENYQRAKLQVEEQAFGGIGGSSNGGSFGGNGDGASSPNDDGYGRPLTDAEKADFKARFGGQSPMPRSVFVVTSGVPKDLGKVSEFCGNAGDVAHFAGLYVSSFNHFAANAGNKFGYISSAEAAGEKMLGSIAKVTKIGGYGIAILGGVTAIAEFRYSKKENADYAKLVVAAYIVGVNFVPVVGPVISIGLGTLDAMGCFDSYYNSFNYYNLPRK